MIQMTKECNKKSIENIDEENKKPINEELLESDIAELLKNNRKLKNLMVKNGINPDSLQQIFKFPQPVPKRLRNQLLVQGATVVIDPLSGSILGMIGGRIDGNYLDHFNRSVQAKRQPGSIFKPFIYMTAL